VRQISAGHEPNNPEALPYLDAPALDGLVCQQSHISASLRASKWRVECKPVFRSQRMGCLEGSYAPDSPGTESDSEPSGSRVEGAYDRLWVGSCQSGW
jgi:hypothetical protein